MYVLLYLITVYCIVPQQDSDGGNTNTVPQPQYEEVTLKKKDTPHEPSEPPSVSPHPPSEVIGYNIVIQYYTCVYLG